MALHGLAISYNRINKLENKMPLPASSQQRPNGAQAAPCDCLLLSISIINEIREKMSRKV
jgi:hypothetical protein